MTNKNVLEQPSAVQDCQPDDVRGIQPFERDLYIITATQVDEQWVVISRYADDVWYLNGFTSNVRSGNQYLDFNGMPTVFRGIVREIFYRYLRRGRSAARRPKGGILRKVFDHMRLFLRYLVRLGVDSLSEITPQICAGYIATCRADKGGDGCRIRPLSQNALHSRLRAVEALYELSQYTTEPIQQHPWPDTSSKAMAGLTGNGAEVTGKTPLMPDDVFCRLFETAYQQVETGHQLLDIRDALDAFKPKCVSQSGRFKARNSYLHSKGWGNGLHALNKALLDLRTACYIVIASTSGCRNHELAYLQSGSHHRTQDDEGTIYHWMRSRSDKTDTGIHDWMIPEAAVKAIRLMERFCSPYQSMIAAEISRRRRVNPLDPKITEASKHRYSIFIGLIDKTSKEIRTISNNSWNLQLKAFAKNCGLDWHLTSHQFRRKFANYAAHSKFGDLRYLKEHFAHWSLDMTLSYAMDETWGQHLDLDLFADIQAEMEDVKLDVVDSWLSDEALAGSYGRSLKVWQRKPRNLLIFKDHTSMLKSITESTAIRSNGHAWCTADDNRCIGNTLDRTRCGGCNHGIIGSRHLPIYKQFYNDLSTLQHCPDIGEGGRQRVLRDLSRCCDVMTSLGVDTEMLTS
jgi:integrase